MHFCMVSYLRLLICISLLAFWILAIPIMFVFFRDHYVGLNRLLWPSFSGLLLMLLELGFIIVGVTPRFLFIDRARILLIYCYMLMI